MYKRRDQLLINNDTMLSAVEDCFQDYLNEGIGVDKTQFLCAMLFHFKDINYHADVYPWIQVCYITSI
jgi:hypothetical protein